jgi:osmotically-inducible protein OsmY
VPSLALKNKLKLFIKNIPSLKGCINLVEVQPLKPISDTIIKARVLTILEDLSIPISNYEVSVQNAVVQIKCCYHNCSTPTDLEQRIEQIEGIKELNLILDFMPVQPLFQEKWFQNAEKALHKNPKLEGSKIRISYHGKKILLEGNVHSLFQKSRAYIATMLSTKKISIENKLRISPYTEEQDVI